VRDESIGVTGKMSEPAIITGDEAREKSLEELFAQLESGPQGLAGAEAGRRLVLGAG
jgi:hypothetical protein